MSIISDASKVASDEILKVLKQRRKRFLSNLTKTINRAEISIENETKISEIALSRETGEFSFFKLQKNIEEICLHASGAEIIKALIIRCERLISQLDDDKQTEITT